MPPRPRAAPRARKSPQAGADSRQQPEADSALASSALPAKRQARPPPGNVHHLTNHPVDLYPGRVGGLRVVIWSCTEEAPGLLDCRISFAPTAFTRGAARDVSRQGIRSPPAPSSRPGRRVEIHAAPVGLPSRESSDELYRLGTERLQDQGASGSCGCLSLRRADEGCASLLNLTGGELSRLGYRQQGEPTRREELAPSPLRGPEALRTGQPRLGRGPGLTDGLRSRRSSAYARSTASPGCRGVLHCRSRKPIRSVTEFCGVRRTFPSAHG